MKNRVKYLILPVITLILEVLPWGAVCNFANYTGIAFRETYSYFDLIPFGYANFSPFLTAITTCIIVVFLIIYFFTGKSFATKTTKVLLYIGIVLSVCPLLYGVAYYSVVGALITISLVSELLMLFTTKSQKD